MLPSCIPSHLSRNLLPLVQPFSPGDGEGQEVCGQEVCGQEGHEGGEGAGGAEAGEDAERPG